jgi:oligopeptide transport system substrate-binding protein
MKLWTLVGLVLIASMLLAACQPETQTVVQTVIVKEKGEDKVITITTTPPPPVKPQRPNILNLNTGGSGDVPTIDPNLATDTTSVQIDMMAFPGITVLDEETSQEYAGMAEKWDVSADGLVYTFHLRNNIPWVKWDGAKKEVVKVQDCEGNDRLVTAHDFEFGILRALDPATASDYAYVLTFAIAGSADYNAGVTTDTTTVGVKAIDDFTLEITFMEDVAYNTNIIGLWTAAPVPQWLINGDDCTEARGDRWTEPGFFQSYGPYTMKEWIHDSTISIVKNPFWPGIEALPVPKIDEVNFIMLDAAPAFAEYEAGNIDAAAVPQADIDRVKADPEMSKELVIAGVTCTYYYGFNTKAPFVDDVRVRRALSEALDRQGLVDNVLKGGQQPAQWFSRPGIAAAPTMESHPDLGVKYNPDDAKKLMDEYLAEKGITAADVDITLMFNTSSGHQTIAEAIQQMWKENLGIDVKLTNQEWKVYLNTIKSPETPQIYRLGWCQDYPDANNFIREVFITGGSANPGDGGVNYSNPEWEELLLKAAVEKDPAKRLEMYAQAEQTLCYDDAVIIPIYWYTRVTTTKPYIKRTFGVGGQENFTKWEILQDYLKMSLQSSPKTRLVFSTYSMLLPNILLENIF